MMTSLAPHIERLNLRRAFRKSRRAGTQMITDAADLVSRKENEFDQSCAELASRRADGILRTQDKVRHAIRRRQVLRARRFYHRAVRDYYSVCKANNQAWWSFWGIVAAGVILIGFSRLVGRLLS